LLTTHHYSLFIPIEPIRDLFDLGSGSGLRDRETKSYPAVLSKLLGLHHHYDVVSFGLPGGTALKQSEVPYWNSIQYNSSLQSNPQIVVIMLGTNDAKPSNWDEARYRRDYRALIQRYQRLPTSPVVMIAIPPPMYYNRSEYGNQIDVINSQLPSIVTQIGQQAHVKVPLSIAFFTCIIGTKISASKKH
jgi:lysophospholipase L1-like esterase